MSDPDLRNEIDALRERFDELEGFLVAKFESQKQATDDRLEGFKRGLVHLKQYTTLGIAGVGLAIALWGATPEARNNAANTWTSGISAALLGALSLAIQGQKERKQNDDG